MPNPDYIKQEAISLTSVKEVIEIIEKRDEELGYLTQRTKEYVDQFAKLEPNKLEELKQKLRDLGLTRLKEEHIIKISDFLPVTVVDLKIVLQAYPLSMPKKDLEVIIGVVKNFV